LSRKSTAALNNARRSSCYHDIRTNLSDDGGEDEDSEHEVDDDEGVLGVGDWQRQVGDGGHGQRRPEECVEVHAAERGVPWVQVRIDAVVDELVVSQVTVGDVGSTTVQGQDQTKTTDLDQHSKDRP